MKDVLSLRFSEPIAGNYLDEDANFEIVGGTNNLDITQTTSLSFSGEKDCVAKTQVHRNMNNRPFTIEALIRPAEQGKAMTIFSLGDTKQKLRFSLTTDNRLQAEVGKATIISAPLEPIQDFTRCAMTYDTDGQVHFYAGTKDMTLPDQPTLPVYTGNGTLLFGNTSDGEEPFYGNMLEARLWTKALAQDELSLTYKKHLTGYERELMAYYPMNEGLGSTCTDHANGATLRLQGTSWTVYVDKNQLRWSQNEITVNTQRNSSEKFDLTISNTGGTTRQYQLTSLPSWLTAVPASGTLSPQATQTIHFTIAEGMNIGEHTEYIYLQDDQDLVERLLLTVKVESVCPWEADSKDLPMSMSLIGQVLLTNGNDTTYDTDTNDIVAAFIGNHCVGTSHITYDDATLDNHVYMTIYGNAEMQQQAVQLRLWQASTGNIYLLNTSIPLTFEHKRCYGCDENGPVLLTTSERKIQQLSLDGGWNWTSLHLKPTYGTDINRMLSTRAEWTAGDMVKDPIGRSYSQYQAAAGDRPAAWYGTLCRFNYRCIYMFYTDTQVSPEIEGEPLTEQDRTLRLFAGWNVLPYLLEKNLPLSEAMADYLSNAKAGDVLKSKDRFAVFSASSKWEGNLTYMEPGQGYLLYRKGEPCTFTYYNYSTSLPRNIRAKATEPALLFTNRASSNMSLIATLADWQGETDNLILSAYAGSRLVGRVDVHPTDSLPLFFLTIGSEQPASIRFVLEQDGKTVAQSAPMLNYEAKVSLVR